VVDQQGSTGGGWIFTDGKGWRKVANGAWDLKFRP